jgi:hypothetical protein
MAYQMLISIPQFTLAQELVMSTMDPSKDDKATQEMLAMMGEQADDNVSASEMDDLLDSIDKLDVETESAAELVDVKENSDEDLGIHPEVTTAENDNSLDDILGAEPVTTSAEKEDVITDDIDLDAILAHDVSESSDMADLLPETSPEAAETEDVLENGAVVDEVADNETEVVAEDAAEEGMETSASTTEIEDPTSFENTLDEVSETEDTENLDTTIDSETIETVDTTGSNATTTDQSDSDLLTHTQDSIAAMQDALAINKDIDQIVADSTDTLKHTIQSAIAVTEASQHKTEQSQKATEDMATAINAAKEAAAAAGIPLSDLETTPPIDLEQLAERLQEIHTQNDLLKEKNAHLQQLIQS